MKVIYKIRDDLFGLMDYDIQPKCSRFEDAGKRPLLLLHYRDASCTIPIMGSGGKQEGSVVTRDKLTYITFKD